MKIKTAKFITSAPSLKECPTFNLPEFALIGRSNVGKSSFINAIVNNKGLAKTSNKPGKTRLINLFLINDAFVIADLPGYGYASVSAKMQNEWQKNLEEYLLNRKEIVSLIQFIDSRHPIQKNDAQMAEWIKFNKIPSFALCVKTDEISKNILQKTVNQIQKQLEMPVLPFSKMTDRYNDAVLKKLDELVKSYK
ncbi:MAG: ribosome biogenesis GTP-binding protein YihA/YsxC [Candidatus Gastranaerophilaceae bacterium]